MIKDPNQRTQIMIEGIKAAQKVLGAGGSQEEAMEASEVAIRKCMESQKLVAKTIESGKEEAAKLISEFEKNFEETSDLVSFDFEINDYPANARQKVVVKDFLEQMHELTSCKISVRGTHVEVGKKVPQGQRKLYLHLEGENKYFVTSAYKEIKRVIEEAAMKHLSMGTHQQPQGKFTM